MAQVRVGIIVKEWRNKDDSKQGFQCYIPSNLGMHTYPFARIDRIINTVEVGTIITTNIHIYIKCD